jgi:nitrogen-specific signal transduction histidine kinase
MKKKPIKTSKPTKKKDIQKKDIGDISYVLSEIRSPLTVITDATKILADLQKESPDAKKEQLLGTVQENLERIGAIIDGLLASEKADQDQAMGRPLYFDVMNKLQQVCATHDILFLQKQLHYHISASADLPKVYANPEQILLVLSNLISNAVKYAPRGSDIEINLKEVSLRQGAGVEATVINSSEDFSERDRYHIFEKFYTGKPGEAGRVGGLGLSICREIIQKSHGQLWVDIPTKGKVAFAFVLPCAEIEDEVKAIGHQTFKYDITLANFEELRTKFGGEKTQNLLVQVEDYVRQLVRYPIDVVTAFEQSGIISTIYETEEGNASSVAARISQKLGSEHFRIGKSEVSLMFQYRLSTLQ